MPKECELAGYTGDHSFIYFEQSLFITEFYCDGDFFKIRILAFFPEIPEIRKVHKKTKQDCLARMNEYPKTKAIEIANSTVCFWEQL